MPNPMDSLPRETAAATDLPRETAEARTFSEEEHTAIVADRVARETAELEGQNQTLQEQVTALTTEKAELQTRLDTAEVARAAAEQALADYKAEVTATAEKAARRAERLASVREAAKHMPDAWFTDQRADEWAAMEQASFDSFLTATKEVSAALTANGGEAGAGAAAETAALQGAPGGDQNGKPTSKGFWDAQKGGNR